MFRMLADQDSDPQYYKEKPSGPRPDQAEVQEVNIIEHKENFGMEEILSF